MMKFRCTDGPHDARTFAYPNPLPELVVFCDAQLHYHEYRRISVPVRATPIYRYTRSYRIRGAS